MVMISSDSMTVTARHGAAFDWLKAGVHSHPVEQVYDGLLEALAQSLLCYDANFKKAYDGPVSHNIGP